MTPVERLQAAIEKLETLSRQTGYYEAHGWLVENVTVGFEYDPREEQAPLTNDELIVTLHRTIDAQLSILRDGIRRVHEWTDPNGELGYNPELDGDGSRAVPLHLALADAILGSDS